MLNWARSILQNRNRVKKEYHDSGALKAEHTYSGDKRHGVTKIFYHDGKLKIRAPFLNGKPHGLFQKYSIDGHLVAEETYKHGVLLLQKTYDNNGELDGVIRQYHDNGIVKIEASFSGGIPDGTFREHLADGTLIAEESYDHGVLVTQKKFNKNTKSLGILRDYYDTGMLRSETNHDENIYREFFSSGSIKVIAPFKAGKPDGIVQELFENGSLKAEDEYRNGKMIGSRRFDEESNVLSATGSLSQKKTETPVFEKRRGPEQGISVDVETKDEGVNEEMFAKKEAEPAATVINEEISEAPQTPAKQELINELKTEPKELTSSSDIAEEILLPEEIIPHMDESPVPSADTGPAEITAVEEKEEAAESIPVMEAEPVKEEVLDIPGRSSLEEEVPEKEEIPVIVEQPVMGTPIETSAAEEKPKEENPHETAVDQALNSLIQEISQQEEKKREEMLVDEPLKPEEQHIPETVRMETKEEQVPDIKQEEIKQAPVPEPVVEEKKEAAAPPTPQPAAVEKPAAPVGPIEIKKETYENGNVKTEIGYADGKREGPAKKYYEDGKVMAEMIYEDDSIISQTIYDKTGRFIFKETRRTTPSEF